MSGRGAAPDDPTALAQLSPELRRALVAALARVVVPALRSGASTRRAAGIGAGSPGAGPDVAEIGVSRCR